MSKLPVPRWLHRHSAVLILSGVVAVSGGMTNTWLSRLELRFAGVVQETRGVRPVPDRLKIVAIDEFSLQQAANADLSSDPLLQSLSQWPWPRRIHAMVLERLIEAGATAVGFDLLFESSSIHGNEDDAAFAEALQRHREQVVLGVQVLNSRGPVAGMSLLDVTPTLRPTDKPIDRGLLNGEPDSDGVIRRRPGQISQPIREQLGSAIPDGLAVALLRKQSESADLSIHRRDLLDPYGPPGTIPTLSIWELIEPNAYAAIKKSGLLRNALVLVGPTAAVLQDLHPAVFSGAQGMPGVELHATELANRLDSRSLHWIPTPRAWNVVMALLVMVAGVSVARLERPLSRLGLLLGSSGLLVAGSAGLIVWSGVLLPVLGLAGSLAITGIVTSADATVRLQWQRRRLRRTLGRYLSPAVAAEIANQPEEADGLLGGQMMDVVILMSDIRGFTGFTKEMTEQGKVKELVTRLNQYFSEVVNAVHFEQGTVDKFIGDAVLAVFGAPLKQNRSANVRAAVRTAIALQRQLMELNRGWEEQGQRPWQQVIVLSHGWVLSGNIGCASRMDYTVIGDAVNTASRLETIAKQTGQSIVMSAAVAEQIEGDIPLHNIGTFTIRGQGEQQVFALRTDTDADDRPDTLQ
ncbi:CHASE2 domain-containing protein [Synechococcus sp. MIT S9508]|uniref:CHASE2 domain-containing protein n=1 Tax=Synechococcus sp. MIT S9508 TaxID=1801629 RepID=UPI0007BB4A25|nr:adenylate/guanylate cyclase domain-containing protein [Synechococcus sp. MIT S9508]KZR86455.1 Adenylate cyclase 1 [Synechococcus sp. MIT S9508]